MDIALGDRVRFIGTIKKSVERWRGQIDYVEAELPEFIGYAWADGKNGVSHNKIDAGVIVGKRRYVPMENDEGLWISYPSSFAFTGYLVAYHLARNPVIVRLDQIVELNGELFTEEPA
jgi:hypothetical protein